jgi:hypothetical protein
LPNDRFLHLPLRAAIPLHGALHLRLIELSQDLLFLVEAVPGHPIREIHHVAEREDPAARHRFQEQDDEEELVEPHALRPQDVQ